MVENKILTHLLWIKENSDLLDYSHIMIDNNRNCFAANLTKKQNENNGIYINSRKIMLFMYTFYYWI